MSPPERFLLSGEFHYFRVPRSAWKDRLATMVDAGLEAASIYIPWNWHQPAWDAVDLTGLSSPERDLRAVLEAITDAGLECIFRPGPFITGEWRQGGIPDWFLQRHPQAAALDATGRPAGAGRLYPAITYRHPAYRAAAREWLQQAFTVAEPYLATRGGPIVNVQLDDEPSYWQRLSDPLAVDYNPVLVGAAGGPSHFSSWLVDRYGSLDALNRAYSTSWSVLEDVGPPRTRARSPSELPSFIDWLEYKLAEVNDHIKFLWEVAAEASIDVQLSMLHPYLLPLGALHCASFIREHRLPIQLTNECYLSLFSGSSAGEQKMGAVLATHETYLMWRGEENGPSATMELQASNSSFITAGAMEVLYALTVARGIRGLNYFMMVGGANPRGFENGTGAEYDIAAPISATGARRAHYDTISKLSSMIKGWVGDRLRDASPLRDVWLGCYQPYEAMLLSMAEEVLSLDGFGETFSLGDIGQSEANSLLALFALNSISFGCVDLERANSERLAPIDQLWVAGGPFMAQSVQESLVSYVRAGGHLVILPMLPRCDEEMRPCTALADFALGEGGEALEPTIADSTVLYGPEGETLVAAGAVRRWKPAPGATPLLHDASGDICGFSRPVGPGRVTVLGFNLRYQPTAGSGQHDFVQRLATDRGRARAAWATVAPCAAFQLRGRDASVLCLVNPVELPAAPQASFTAGDGNHRERLPLVLPGVEFTGRGARLLPVQVSLGGGVVLRHATWELLAIDAMNDAVRLTFASAGSQGEIAIYGVKDAPRIAGATMVGQHERGPLRVYVVAPDQPTVEVVVPTGRVLVG